MKHIFLSFSFFFFEISQFKRLLNQPSKKKKKRGEKKKNPFECCLNLNEKPFVVHSVGFVKTNAHYIKPIIYPPDKDQTNID